MNTQAVVKRLWSLPNMLHIEWSDGTLSEFASLWLRDNLREDRDAHSGQRLIDIADLPEDPRIRAATAHNGAITVEWENEARTGLFELPWLQAHAANRAVPRPEFTPRRWLEGARLDAVHDFAWATFSEAQSNRSLRTQWLNQLLQDGIAFLSSVPATDAGILDAAALAGRVSETNYGRVFDVRSVPQPENLAYSDLGLGLHTDNPYREPVPGFQVLHVLIASPDGGDSLFGDGFAIAEHMRGAFPDAFAILTQTPVPFLYRSENAELPLRLAARAARPFYSAYRCFAALLRDSRFHLQISMRDGDLVVFDNQRTLHGRTAFSSARHPRHLRGCYLTRDSVYSEAALLRRELHAKANS